jgi:hypothetical protein
VLKGRLTLFRWLCEAGADTAARNFKGQAPRDLVEARLAGAGAPPPASREEGGALEAMRELHAAADRAPPPPPAPLLVDASRSALALVLAPPSWDAGSTVPFAVEVQFARRGAALGGGVLGLGGLGDALGLSSWSVAAEAAPSGVNIFAPA